MNLKDTRAMLRIECPDIVIRKTECGEYRVTFALVAIQSVYPAMSRQVNRRAIIEAIGGALLLMIGGALATLAIVAFG